VFAFQASAAPVELAFTDRHGGSSGGPFASLNLAEPGSASAPDAEREAVRRNLDLVVRTFTGVDDDAAAAPPVVRLRQVHGADVAVVDRAGDPPEADAVVTATPGLVLMVRVADCVPVLLADPAAGVVGAAHAGRPGLVAGVVPATVAAMRELGATELRAWVGPHVCGGCYEVPERMRAEVCAVVPEAAARTRWGTPAVDIGAGVVAELASSGVPAARVGACTVEDDDLFSYRRQGVESGRLAGLVWVRA
jgi:YfiH family protein